MIYIEIYSWLSHHFILKSTTKFAFFYLLKMQKVAGNSATKKLYGMANSLF